MNRLATAVVGLACVCSASIALAQPPPQIAVTSPEIAADGRVTFRVLAAQAQSVKLTTPGDIREVVATPAQFMKNEQGVWEATVGPIAPGAYRYTFNIDGVPTIDPRNPLTAESINNPWSLMHIPGAAFMDAGSVPHGSVATIYYQSTTLSRLRRMHVYTPPGYERGTEKLPVFYLLHGAGDSDDAWSSVGRAGFIIDNLIAAGKAKPMIVVMPAGHTARTSGPGGVVGRPATEEFVRDFTNDIVPYVESHYRVLTDRAHTAIAGLSMGGVQTLHIVAAHLEKFAYIGVYSSGLIGAFPGIPSTPGRGTAPPANPPPAGAAPPLAADWERTHAANLDNANLKKGLQLFWFSTGKEDGLLQTSIATVDLLKKHGFTPEFHESPGGHTWINWRNYLNEFAPQLFQPPATRSQSRAGKQP
jgi:enterochelin esterase family protein